MTTDNPDTNSSPAESPSSRPMTLRQQLAAIEHERWSDWQRWCHKILRENLGNDNIELERVLERWEVQIATPYKMLSDAEKASDMEQVDRYWPLIERWCQEIAREAEKRGVEALAARITNSTGVSEMYGWPGQLEQLKEQAFNRLNAELTHKPEEEKV